jgi:hypothetical protein
MNNTLLYLLSQEELDVTAIVKLITFGKPKKFWGFNTGGYEPVNLFDRESGETAFHLLARKGKLSDVLPTLFDNAETILAREGIVVPRSLGMSLEASAQAVIFNFLMKPNSTGFNALHFTVYSRDYAALDNITERGFDLNVAEVVKRDDEVLGIRHLSPMKFAFNEQDKAVDFVTTSIVNDYSNLFDYMYPFLITEHCRIIPNVVKAVKDASAAGGDITTKLSSFNNFARLFNDGWFDVLASDVNAVVIQKMSRLMNLLTYHYNEYWRISENQLKILIGQEIGLSVERNVLIQAVQKHVLDTYARQYLVGVDIDLELGKIFVRSQGIFDRDDLAAVEEGGLLSRELVAKMEDFVYRGNVQDGGDALSVIPEDIAIIEVESVVDARVVVKEPALVEMVGSGSADKDVQVAVSVDLVPRGKRVASVEEYIATVISLINDPRGGCKTGIVKDLTDGKMIKYTELHSVISVATRTEGYFISTVLPGAAQVLDAQPISYIDFVFGYVQALKEQDLITPNLYRKISAFELACARDNLTWVKALFEKSVELGVYDSTTYSIYDIALKINAKHVLKYLLAEQDLVVVDWSKVLMKSLHHANVDAVRYYVESDAEIITVTTDRNKMAISGKYTILNKGLDSLLDLAELRHHKTSEKVEQAMDKLINYVECLLILIKSEKLYCCIDKQDVLSKTFQLVSGFVKYTNHLSEVLETRDFNVKLKQIAVSCTELKDLLIGVYDKILVSASHREGFEIIKGGDFPDNMSDVTWKSGFSIMSGIYTRDGESFHDYDDKENVSQSLNIGIIVPSKLHVIHDTHEEESSSSAIIGVTSDTGADLL